MKRIQLLAAVCGCACFGCVVEAPIDPAGVLGVFDSLVPQFNSNLDKALADPLGSKPFPAILGGDSERIFYATNLADIRVRFPGPTNDLVLPGIVGPSNIYVFANRERELIRALTPVGTAPALANLVTDGRYLAYIVVTENDGFLPSRVVVSDLEFGGTQVVHEADSERIGVFGLAIDDGRLAFRIVDLDAERERLRVEDLSGLDPALEFESDRFWTHRLNGNRLAYVEVTDGGAQVVLRDLTREDSILFTADVSNFFVPDIALADNTLVWTEGNSVDIARVMAYDIPTGTTRVWVDAVEGQLVGASDEFFLTQVRSFDNRRHRVAVWRYDADGVGKKLAKFDQDGFAGQAQVLGDRAVWVNPERKIVIQPLAGGDRKIFRPF